MSDRLTGLITIIVVLAFFVSATKLEAPFFADPLGPKAFPMLISSICLIAGIFMILRPDKEPQWPELVTLMRIVLATVILIVYAYSLKPLGFLLSTALATATLSYQIKPAALQSVFVGFLMSGGLFIIFKFALGLSLFALPRWLMG